MSKKKTENPASQPFQLNGNKSTKRGWWIVGNNNSQKKGAK